MTHEEKPAKEIKEGAPARARMQFILRGFHHEAGSRVFTFDGVASDKTRKVFTVHADLALSRQYGIQFQELPLLCLSLLDESCEAASQDLIYSETDMRAFALNRSALRELAAQKKRPPRKAPVENVGLAWRVPQQFHP